MKELIKWLEQQRIGREPYYNNIKGKGRSYQSMYCEGYIHALDAVIKQASKISADYIITEWYRQGYRWARLDLFEEVEPGLALILYLDERDRFWRVGLLHFCEFGLSSFQYHAHDEQISYDWYPEALEEYRRLLEDYLEQ